MAAARHSGRHGYDEYRGWHHRCDRRDSASRYIPAAIGPLLAHLEAYDRLRLTLEQQGGTVADLQGITSHLQTPFAIRGGYANGVAKLTDQVNLQDLLRDVDYDLRLDVRQRPSGMPVYFLCRTHSDYWNDTRLILEDYYLSSGYPMADERFVRLMRAGHEVYFLRLSPFRVAAAALSDQPDLAGETVDTIVREAGVLVLHSAWHEDQRLAGKVARHFRLPRLMETIELLYFCLSADLSQVRNETTPRLLWFFEHVYPQPAIRRLLGVLGGAEGTAIAAFPRRAKEFYPRLLTAFGRFLATEIPWGRQGLPIPLWKAVYANYGRLELVGAVLSEQPAIIAARTAVEDTADAIRQHVLADPG